VAIDHRQHDFVDATLEATDGRGVDVAFDPIGGEVTTRTFQCMAFGGRHLLVGFAAGIEAEDEGIVPRPILFGNFDLAGVCLAYVDDPLAVKRASSHNFPSAADARRLHRELVDLIVAGELHPVVDREVPFTELPTALEAMERRDTIGRVVVRVSA
jgi:NADPH2:quinone reductase